MFRSELSPHLLDKQIERFEEFGGPYYAHAVGQVANWLVLSKRGRLRDERQALAITKQDQIGPDIPATNGRHVMCEWPIASLGPSRLPSKPPPVPHHPFGEPIGR